MDNTEKEWAAVVSTTACRATYVQLWFFLLFFASLVWLFVAYSSWIWVGGIVVSFIYIVRWGIVMWKICALLDKLLCILADKNTHIYHNPEIKS